MCQELINLDNNDGDGKYHDNDDKNYLKTTTTKTTTCTFKDISTFLQTAPTPVSTR